jgi:nucleoside-diphosphate-sugar epimerase
MRILITGGAGFLGARLAREILKRGHLNGQSITELVIADLFPAPTDLQADPRVKSHAGPMLEQGDLFKSGFDGVFHLASAVSGECELDFDLGMRSNLDSTRLLLDSLRASGKVPRLVFASSVAVFGPDAANPMPDKVTDTTLPSPQTSYGTHKLMLEYLVADCTRKGFIDGRAARLMTVAVRPGKPHHPRAPGGHPHHLSGGPRCVAPCFIAWQHHSRPHHCVRGQSGSLGRTHGAEPARLEREGQ